MERLRRFVVLTTIMAVGTACGSSSGTSDAADAGPNTVQVTIFHTADEHGWIVPWVDEAEGVVFGGAADLLARMVAWDEFDPARHVFLSGGDNWTGAAVSTWFDGESTVEVFNAMGYQASALGNHEFDFGRDALSDRIAEASYPYLAANVTYAADGSGFADVARWLIIERAGINIGVIGLAHSQTATQTFPDVVSDLRFGDYAEAVDAAVSEARANGAVVIVVLSHACSGALTTMMDELSVRVDVVFGAHCHVEERVDIGDVPIVSSGRHLDSYSVTTVNVNVDEARATGTSTLFRSNTYAIDDNPLAPDPTIAALVDSWQQRADQVLQEQIGYSEVGIVDGTWTQANWVTDAWLWKFPTADVAITNRGGLRQSIDAGPVSVGDVVSMMPFDNGIVQVSLTGAQLHENLARSVVQCPPPGCVEPVAGMSYIYDGTNVTITLDGGGALDMTATYNVLVNDYMYFGGAGYDLQAYDPEPYDTGLNYREPVIDWTRAQQTSSGDPLEAHVDGAPRNLP